MRMVLAGRTDRGRVRPRNEDALLQRPERGLVAVADGMGGHAAGDIASRIAVDVVDERTAVRLAPDDDAGRRLDEAIRAAHDAILRASGSDAAMVGMGTTLTALWLPPGARHAVIGHVGDSRAYRLRGHDLERLTRDQTWVQDQVDAGLLTEQSARHHPYAAILTCALGVESEGLEVQVIRTAVAPDDRFLLCSDGLTARLDDDDLHRLLSEHSDLEVAATALVDAANRAGGTDNITVALVQLSA